MNTGGGGASPSASCVCPHQCLCIHQLPEPCPEAQSHDRLTLGCSRRTASSPGACGVAAHQRPWKPGSRVLQTPLSSLPLTATTSHPWVWRFRFPDLESAFLIGKSQANEVWEVGTSAGLSLCTPEEPTWSLLHLCPCLSLVEPLGVTHSPVVGIAE